jgi:hypothetical protein
VTCVAAVLLAAPVLAGCTDDDEGTSPSTPTTAAAPAPITVVNRTAWPMHPIDGRYRGANGLGAADVNGDGHRDYITNYEFDQRWIVALHPGDTGDTDVSWPTVEVWKPDPFVSGNGKNPESSALGDFDGDGNVDAAGAHGFSEFIDFEGTAPGVHLVWGPSRDRVEDPSAWTDGGWVPATVDVGHPHWIVAHDVNGDGLTDVAYGGRQHGGGGGYESADIPSGNGTFTGISWLEAPSDPAARRDLAQWQLHRIDPDVPSGHGFVFADLDGDGDDDIVDATADFDTTQEQEDVAWYENPGPDDPAAQRGEWRRTSLFQSSDFYAKPSVAVGDLDGDGDPDLVTQTDTDMIFFRNTGDAAVTFEAVTVPKPPEISWRSRPVRIADFDRDGDLDVFGMLIHDSNELPPDKASAYLLLNQGQPFSPAGWDLVPVKWGPGPTMTLPGFGEKWDQVDVTDVDGDGDLDVVANNEEWWASPDFEAAPFFTPGLTVSSVAVVWFENTLGDPAPVTTEADGRIVIEAERPSVTNDSSWVERAPVRADTSRSLGDPAAALQAHNGLLPPGDGTLPPEATTGVSYDVDAAGGDYVVWARILVPTAFGKDLGGVSADSAWLSVGTGPPVLLEGGPDGATDTWLWVRAAEPLRLDPGAQTLTLRNRERGLAVDKLVLTTDTTFRPG